MEPLALAAPADERRVEAACDTLRCRVDRQQPVRGDRLGLALEIERCHLLDADRVADQPVRLHADQHLAGPGGLLEPRRDVHGVARDDRLALAGDDLAGVDADPQLGPLQLCGRPDRAQRVVLVRPRDPEDGHHGVADELLHRAAVAPEDRPRVLEPVSPSGPALPPGRGTPQGPWSPRRRRRGR